MIKNEIINETINNLLSSAKSDGIQVMWCEVARSLCTTEKYFHCALKNKSDFPTKCELLGVNICFITDITR